MKANSIKEAWEMANEIFPSDYEHDASSSERAGYPIYRSTVKENYYDRICDLGCRLEVVLDSSKRPSVNIFIEEPKEETEANISNYENRRVEVAVTASKSGEVKRFANYDEFINLYRFFMSGGAESQYEDSDEAHFKKIVDALTIFNDHGLAMKTFRSGMAFEFTYKRWNDR